MSRRCVTLCLAATLVLAAQDAPSAADLHLLVHKTDALLREANGSLLKLDPADTSATQFRRPTHRVYWHSRSEDRRLVGITIEPVGEEDQDTAVLTSALLVTLRAVDNLEAGLAMTQLVRSAQESNGQSRQVALGRGIKLQRLRADEAPARYKILL